MSENVKTPEGMFLEELQSDFGFTPVVSRAVVERAQEMVGYANYGCVGPGQMRMLVVSREEPAGKPLTRCKIIPVTLTVDEDPNCEDHIAQRMASLCRISEEALDQGGVLTQADAARALRCSVRTVRRDVRIFKERGIWIPLRGQLIGTGKGQTHKVKIVELYLKGLPWREIQARTFHSVAAIMRYVKTFARVAACLRKGLPPTAIPRIVGLSERLAGEYEALYRRYDCPGCRERIDALMGLDTVASQKRGLK